MLDDSLCRRCPYRTGWLNARDDMYQKAYHYSKLMEKAQKLKEEAEVHLERAKALDERVQRNLKLVNALTDDLKAEMARPEEKPSLLSILTFGILGKRR